MKLPLSIAEKLLILVGGEPMPASKLKHPIIEELLAEGIIYKPGKRKGHIHLLNKEQLSLFLRNRFSISNLSAYIEILKKADAIRADLIPVSGDSKTKKVRTFKGFLVNCYSPVQNSMNGEAFTVFPKEGTFSFIHDFENFTPGANITVIGVENPENFRYIRQQEYLFKDFAPLFVSRYPQTQNKDLLNWLKSIPNNYLHFGDFDFSGIGIYLNEYKKHLGDRASFFIPENLDNLIKKAGSRERYDIQRITFDQATINEDRILILIESLHRNKKGLDQEIFIREEQVLKMS